MPLFRAFAAPLPSQGVVAGRDQFTEAADLVGLFLGARVGSSATLLGDLLSQHTVGAPNCRIACDNRFTQLHLLFLDLEGQFTSPPLSGHDICKLATAPTRWESMCTLGKGCFNQLWGRCPVRQCGPIGPWNITAAQRRLPQEADSFRVLGLMEALDRRDRRSRSSALCRRRDATSWCVAAWTVADGKDPSIPELMPIELGDNLA